jgi:hypothetical protein
VAARKKTDSEEESTTKRETTEQNSGGGQAKIDAERHAQKGGGVNGMNKIARRGDRQDNGGG